MVRLMEDAVTDQTVNIVVRIAKVSAQNCCVMLPEIWSIEFQLIRKSRETKRKAGDLEIAENPIVNGSYCAALEQMRMVHCLGN